MNLSTNFTLEELIATSVRLDNTPPTEVVARLKNLAVQLETVRAILGKPVLINSGYRSPAVNAAVRGVATSDHLKGDAADFICPGFGHPYEVCKRLESALVVGKLKVDQLILERTWTHISFGPRMRGQLLTIPGDGRTLPGIVHV